MAEKIIVGDGRPPKVQRAKKRSEPLEISLICTEPCDPERLKQLRAHHKALMAPQKGYSPLLGPSQEYWPTKYRK